MASLKVRKTEENLKAAFAGESQANRRYLYFAQKADVEGYNDVSAVFRSTAEGETGHAHGHLEFLEEVGDPGDRPADRRAPPTICKAAIAGETHEYTDMYPGMARTAREEGFDEIADWFETWPRPRNRTPAASRRPSTRSPKPEPLFASAAHSATAIGAGIVALGTVLTPVPAAAHGTEAPRERCGCEKAVSKRRRVTRSRGRIRISTDRAKTEAEMRRIFDICHGCRRCFNLCDAFPRLFDLIDNSPTGELDGVDGRRLPAGRRRLHAVRHVLHDEVPLCAAARIRSRFPACHAALPGGRARGRHGCRWRAANWARPTATARWRGLWRRSRTGASERDNKLTRPLLEKVTDVDRNAALPKYHGRTFVMRARRDAARGRPRARRPSAARRCSTPPVSSTTTTRASARRRAPCWRATASRRKSSIPAAAACRSWRQAISPRSPSAAHEVATALGPCIDQGYDIVALVPSCALMLKFEWPLIVPDDPGGRRTLEATFDVSRIHRRYRPQGGARARSEAARRRRHAALACHARAQNMGQKAAEMLRLMPDSRVSVIERCSGHGGSWGVMKDNFETALKVGRPVVRQALRDPKPFVASECPLAGCTSHRDGAAGQGRQAAPPASNPAPDRTLRPRLWSCR